MAPHPAACGGCGSWPPIDVTAEGEQLGTPWAPVGATEGGGATCMAAGASEEEIGGGSGGGTSGCAIDEPRDGDGARMDGFFNPSLAWRVFPPLPDARRRESPAGGGSMGGRRILGGRRRLRGGKRTRGFLRGHADSGSGRRSDVEGGGRWSGGRRAMQRGKRGMAREDGGRRAMAHGIQVDETQRLNARFTRFTRFPRTGKQRYLGSPQ
jgi:hypothetical protein